MKVKKLKVESLKSVRDKIKSLVKGQVLFDEPMSRHTSFRIGGPADYWVEPEDLEDLKRILKLSSDNCLPWKVLGRGTNILVRDEGFPGIIVTLKGDCFRELEFCEEKVDREDGRLCRVIAGAGVLLSCLVSEAVQRGLRGLEFAVGIPGTVGGAVAMNAGTREKSLMEVVDKIEVLNAEGKVSTLRKEQIGFRYRGSDLSPDQVILKVELGLKKGKRKDAGNLMNEFKRQRNVTQPLSEPSAGCIFKNPPGGISAGELIEKAELKGARVGDAQISLRHANFIVNRGEARAEDVIILMERVRDTIRERMGIDLEPEIEIIGL